jgi:hypothetical protein
MRFNDEHDGFWYAGTKWARRIKVFLIFAKVIHSDISRTEVRERESERQGGDDPEG